MYMRNKTTVERKRLDTRQSRVTLLDTIRGFRKLKGNSECNKRDASALGGLEGSFVPKKGVAGGLVSGGEEEEQSQSTH